MARIAVRALAGALLVALSLSAHAAAFTYQGSLSLGGVVVTGSYDLSFTLYDAETEGTAVAATVTREDVAVQAGRFLVELDFGAAAADDSRWLEIAVRPGDSTGDYTPLTPRQRLTPAPRALAAASVPWSGLTGVPAGFADGIDHDTVYTAGEGLAQVGTIFRLDTGYTDGRYLRSVSSMQTLAGSLNIPAPDGTGYLHPSLANGSRRGIGAQAFSSDLYLGSAPGSTIVLGDASPVHVPGVLYSSIFYDRDNANYCIDAAGTSTLHELRISVLRDIADGGYYIDPNGVSVLHDLSATKLTDRVYPSFFLQPGNTSVLRNVQADAFMSRTNPSFSVAPDSTSVLNELRVGRLYDLQDSSYYLDPAGVSRLQEVYANRIVDTDNTNFRVDPAGGSDLNYVSAQNIMLYGQLARTAGMPNMPIAYGTVAPNGILMACTSGVGCYWDAANTRYEISINGVNFDSSQYAATVTGVSSAPFVFTTSSTDGKLLVYCHTLAGVRAPAAFSFTVHKP